MVAEPDSKSGAVRRVGSSPTLETMKTKLEDIEKSLKAIEEEIANYVPPTKWEAANDRMLKRLHARRKELEFAIERKKERKTWTGS